MFNAQSVSVLCRNFCEVKGLKMYLYEPPCRLSLTTVEGTKMCLIFIYNVFISPFLLLKILLTSSNDKNSRSLIVTKNS